MAHNPAASAQGATGATGSPGTAATIAVGTVTTVAPGEDATVVNSGTANAAVLDFEIPQGDDGDPASSGNMLALLSNTQNVSGALTLDGTAMGKLHICTATSADYTMTLPAVSGLGGQLIGFAAPITNTHVVTLDGNASEAIDGATTLALPAGTTAILYCTGVLWLRLAGVPEHISSAAPVTLTDAATIVVNASAGAYRRRSHFRVTIAGNRTLGNPTGAVDGHVLLFDIKQDGTGSRTLALDTKFRFGSVLTSITLTTTAGKTDKLLVIYHAGDDKFDVVSFQPGF